jgi:O-antigen/teichoic acid export membrane protein
MNAPAASLTPRVIRHAAVLTFGTHLASQAIRMLSNLALTRLLAPDAFGVMLIASAVWAGLTLMSDFGFRQVVVRSKNADDPEFLNTVWTLQIAQGAMIAMLLLVSAALLGFAAGRGWVPTGSTLASESLPGAIAGLSVAALLSSAQSTKLDLAGRRLDLFRVALIEIGSQVLALVITLWSASRGGGVAALIAGACVAAGTRSAASHLLLSGPSNRFAYSASAAQEIFGFGRWIVLTSCAGFLVTNGDRLMLGALVGSTEMGHYAIAALLALTAHDLVSKLVSRIAYPALSSAYAAGSSEFHRAYDRARSLIDLACLTSAGIVITCGDLLVRALYDERYAESGTYFRLLGISLLGIRFRVLPQLFMIIGRPGLMLYEQAFQIVVLLAGCVAGHHFAGATGAVAGVAISYLVGPLPSIIVAGRTTELRGMLNLATELRSGAILLASLSAGGVLRLLASPDALLHVSMITSAH